MAFLSDVLFHYPKTALHWQIRWGLTLILYIAGALFLADFFDFGDVRLAANDWTKEYMYLNALREAQLTGEIPWLWSKPFYHDTDKLLANPEIIFTPHIILLRWMSNVSFVILHVIAFYSIGFWACVRIGARFHLGFIPFCLLWLLFNMNGFITAHLGIGHLQWVGYYLIPAFLLLFARLHGEVRQDPVRMKCTAIHISLLLFLLILNGSFHIAIWCMMFMLISVLWDRLLFFNVAYGVGIAVVLGIFRLLPAALYFPESPAFTSGYPSLTVLLDALTAIRGRHYTALGGSFGELRWWEYTIHVGFVALILLSAGLAVAIRRKRLILPFPLIAASLTLFVLSLGDVYAFIAESGLPFSTVQRVSTRFISIPLLVFFIVAIKGLDAMLKRGNIAWRKAVLIAIPFIAFELITHTALWRVDHLESLRKPAVKPLLTLRGNPSEEYTRNIILSWAASKSSLIILLLLLARKRPEARGLTIKAEPA